MALLLVSKIIILFTLQTVALPCGYGNSVSFNFSSFTPNTHFIGFEGDAFVSDGALHLTRSGLYDNLTNSVGRASFSDPLLLWDAKSGTILDFTTRFSFVIKPGVNNPKLEGYGDGLSFFMAKSDSVLPQNSSGGYLGLFDPKSGLVASKANQILAVEFDTFPNSWDRNQPGPHVGIDINSIVSEKTGEWLGAFGGKIAHVLISYNTSSDNNLNVCLAYGDGNINPVFGNPVLSYVVNLTEILPPRVRIGFSASTGSSVELNQILSWEFISHSRNS